MASLRELIDCKAVDTQSKSDVFNHLKDVKDKQADVDVATLKLHQKLAPAKQLIQQVDQEHPLPGQEQQQQQFDSQGNPIPMQNQQPQPGMQTNPASATQQTNQNIQKSGAQPQAGQKKPAFGNANKTSTKDKISNDQNDKAKKKQVGGKKGLEIHVKAEEDDEDTGDIDSKKSKKKLHGRFDYHDNPGKDSGAGRAIGLSGGGPGSGRKPVGGVHELLVNHGFGQGSTSSSTEKGTGLRYNKFNYRGKGTVKLSEGPGSNGPRLDWSHITTNGEKSGTGSKSLKKHLESL